MRNDFVEIQGGYTPPILLRGVMKCHPPETFKRVSLRSKNVNASCPLYSTLKCTLC